MNPLDQFWEVVFLSFPYILTNISKFPHSLCLFCLLTIVIHPLNFKNVICNQNRAEKSQNGTKSDILQLKCLFRLHFMKIHLEIKLLWSEENHLRFDWKNLVYKTIFDLKYWWYFNVLLAGCSLKSNLLIIDQWNYRFHCSRK